MMIRTTINIGADVHKMLKDAAKKHGIEIEEVIMALMRYFSKKNRRNLVAFDGVRYQERSENPSWECVHVNWFGEEYELLIDLRKVHKKSVSRLIAEVVLMYFNKISSIIDIFLDNYHEKFYAIAKFTVHNSIGCIFFWGYPKKSITT